MIGLLAGKRALVTGASRGIGAGIAKGLAAAGATVVVNYATDRSSADAVVNEITDRGGDAWAVQADVSNPKQVAGMFEEIERQQETIDVLVNNAGVHATAPIEAVSVEQFRRLFDTNVLGMLLSTQAALPLMGPSGGSIINISALAGRLGSADMSLYAGSKGAVDSITVSLAKELGARRIRVNALSPGAVDTNGLAGGGFLDDGMVRTVLASTPLGRLGRPDDIANLAVLLASDASYWMTGQVIFAAGGLTY